MDFEEEPTETQPRNGPKKRFRKNKLKLVFNPDDRKDFLLGFRKRKQERKEKYIEKLERDLKKEKKRIKQQTQRAVSKLSNSHDVLPEVKSIIENMPEREETYDLGNTLVSITSLDDQIYRNFPVKTEESSDEDNNDKQRLSQQLVEKIRQRATKQCSDESDNDELSTVVKTDPFFNSINDDELSGSDISSEEKEVHYNPLEMLRKNTTSTTTESDKTLSKTKLEKQANRMLQESEAYKKMQKLKQKRSSKFRKFRLQPTETGTNSEGKFNKGKVSRIKVGVSKQKSKHGKRK